MAKKGKAKKKKAVTRQPQGDSKSVKKKRRKKKKLQKYQAPVPTKDTAMPIQSDSDADDDSSSGETKPEKIQKLLESYTKYQRINFLVNAAVPNAFLFTRLRDATNRDISRRKLVIYSLVWDTTQETLVSAFESYGEIENCNVIFDLIMGKTKGYSFIQFKVRREAAKALKQPRKKIKNLRSRTTDLVTSTEGILPMIGVPSMVQVVWKAGLILSPNSQRFHMGWVDNGGPPMYSHHHEGVGASSKQVMMVEGQHVWLILHSVVEPNECASLSSIPHGIWYCPYCQNMFQRDKFVERNANAVAAGRVSGIDPIEEITKRCIRIVKNPEDAEVIACVLCRGSDFSKSGFGPQTVIVCDQCEKEYHVGCLKEHKMANLKKLPKGKWFCCMGCRMTYSALQNLLTCGEEKIQDSLLDVIKKKHEDKVPHMVSDFDVRWRVLNGNIASRETRMLLSKAVAIFHECFDPIVDSGTGRDLIPSMVYGRSSRGQDFGGMYCAVLMVNSSIVSAGIFRLFGQEIAELPLVATSNDNQGKGYFQILFSCIEKLLASFNVKNLVLPAADQAVSIWTDKFGFERIPPEQLSNYNKTYGQMMTFKGTCMLQKVIPR